VKKSLIAILFCWACITVFSAGSLHAQVLWETRCTIDGPHHVAREKRQFSADAAGVGQLMITKTTPGKKIHNGYLFLNGQKIFLHDFLRGRPLVFEKQVGLKPRNELTFFMTGQPGAAVTIAFSSETAPIAQPPEASLSVAPASIAPGDGTLLSWTTSGADTVSIAPDIGAVAGSGTVSTTPAQTTTYTLTASGPGGKTTAQALVTVVPAIGLTVDSPRNGDTIDAPVVNVQGSFTNVGGQEIGITVNGVVALIDGQRFVANQVPLQPGANTITVRAVDAEARSAEARIDLSADTSQPRIHLSVTTLSGLAPLETDLTIHSPAQLTSSQVTVDGPADAQVIQNDAGHYSLVFDAPGLYAVSAAAADAQNSAYSDSIVLQVLDRNAVDSLLRKKWGDMKAKLAAGDIQGALSYYSAETRAIHEEIFTALADQLPEIAAEMRDIELVSIEDGFANYRIARSEVHQGKSYEITYDVYFACGLDGLWKIFRF